MKNHFRFFAARGFLGVGEKIVKNKLQQQSHYIIILIMLRAFSLLTGGRVLTVLPHPHCQVFHKVLKECFMTRQVYRREVSTDGG